MHQSGHLILADFDLSKHQVHEFNSNEKKPSMVSYETQKTSSHSSYNSSSSHTPSTGVANFKDQRSSGGASVVHDQRAGTNVVLFDRKTGTTSSSGGRTSGCCGCLGGGGGGKGIQVPVIDTEEHLKVDHFGDQLAQSFVGTFEYIAPEIIQYEGYAGSVDWWAFGILLFEMLYGKTPFKGKDNDDTLANTFCGEFEFPAHIPSSKTVQDLLKQLLAHDVKDRLGSPNSIRKHDFFQSVNWPLIRHMEPPYVPEIQNALDTRNFRHFDAFVDSDEEYEEEEEKEEEKEVTSGAAEEGKEEETSSTVLPGTPGGGGSGGSGGGDSGGGSGAVDEDSSDDEPDMITPSHMKQDLSFTGFGYLDKIGERHWGLVEAPTEYGTLEHIRTDCVESPVSKAYRASFEQTT